MTDPDLYPCSVESLILGSEPGIRNPSTNRNPNKSSKRA
jgi:hypothetical protein